MHLLQSMHQTSGYLMKRSTNTNLETPRISDIPWGDSEKKPSQKLISVRPSTTSADLRSSEWDDSIASFFKLSLQAQDEIFEWMVSKQN